MPGVVGLPRTTDAGALEVEVWWVDRFGNAQLNVGPEELTALGVEPGGVVEVRAGDAPSRPDGSTRTPTREPSELVLLVDSYGLLLARARSSLRRGRVRPRARALRVTLVPPGVEAD